MVVQCSLNFFLPWQPIFDTQVFQKMEYSSFKVNEEKLTSLIVVITFGGFLYLKGNPEIQDGIQCICHVI